MAEIIISFRKFLSTRFVFSIKRIQSCFQDPSTSLPASTRPPASTRSHRGQWPLQLSMTSLSTSSSPVLPARSRTRLSLESPGKLLHQFKTILSSPCSGEFLGKNQRIILHLLDLPFQEQVLKGVQAELHDCAFPLLDDVIITSNLTTAFKDVNYNFLVGAKPRGPGMERADLLKDNGKSLSMLVKRLFIKLLIVTVLVQVMVCGQLASTVKAGAS